MDNPIISGIQQMGIGVTDVHEAWKWYRKHLEIDIKVFEEAATADLMLPYTNGTPKSRHAILALSRAIGESAPLLLVGAAGFIAYLPISPMDGYTVLPIQIYNWTSRPQEEFHSIAGSAIIVLLVALLMMNAAAIYLRLYFRKKLSYLHS